MAPNEKEKNKEKYPLLFMNKIKRGTDQILNEETNYFKTVDRILLTKEVIYTEKKDVVPQESQPEY